MAQLFAALDGFEALVKDGGPEDVLLTDDEALEVFRAAIEEVIAAHRDKKTGTDDVSEP